MFLMRETLNIGLEPIFDAVLYALVGCSYLASGYCLTIFLVWLPLSLFGWDDDAAKKIWENLGWLWGPVVFIYGIGSFKQRMDEKKRADPDRQLDDYIRTHPDQFR